MLRADRGGALRAAASALAAVLLLSGCSSLRFWGGDKDESAATSTEAPILGPVAAPPGAVDSIVAVVDGEPITGHDLDRYVVTGGPFLSPEVRDDRRALLDSMIEQKLLRAEYEAHGIVASDEMVDRYIAGVLEDGNQSRADLDADIRRAGITWDDYRERMREEVQRIQLVNLMIRSRVNVPEEEVRAYWESDEAYLESEKVVLAGILLPLPPDPLEAAVAREKAIEVRREAVKNFEAAARKYSKGPAASDGGKLGDFKRGSMAPQFEKALEGLGKGKVSEPVEGGGGIWIVKLVDVKSAGRRPFDEVKEELAEQLYQKRLAERYRKWATEDLRADHRIEILAENLGKPAS